MIEPRSPRAVGALVLYSSRGLRPATTPPLTSTKPVTQRVPEQAWKTGISCPNSLPLRPLDPSGLPPKCCLVLVAAGPHVVVGVKDDLFAVGMPRAAASSFGGRFLIGWAKSRDSEGRNKEPTRRLWLLTLD